MDLNNFSSLDEFRVLSPNLLYNLRVNHTQFIFRIDQNKNDFDSMNGLDEYQLSQRYVVLDKIEDVPLYIDSEFKEGYEIYNFQLTQDGLEITKNREL